MIIYSCKITLLIYDSYSLKDKRSVIKSIINKSKNKFNISIAEIDSLELHNKAIIGVCCVSNSNVTCEQIIQGLVRFITSNYNIELLDTEFEQR